MLGNTFGRLFRITSCGESYGDAMMIILDGMPAGIRITDADVQKDLDRRRPGTSPLDSPRQETDQVKIVSGMLEGCTTGAPLGMIIYNVDRHQIHVDQYRQKKDLHRPGHAELTYYVKYGDSFDWCGAGRASGRETVGRVAAGAVAKLLLARESIEVVGYVKELYGIKSRPMPFDQIKANLLKTKISCPDLEAAQKMIEATLKVKEEGDTVGGIIEVIARGVPAGLGEPAYDKISATIAHGLMSIPAVKGIEFGAGFELARMKGSQANDIPYVENGKIKFRTNHAGGVLGGITNGDDLVLRVVVKPTSTISIPQETINMVKMENTKLAAITRRDPTSCGRAVVVCEAVVAICIVDHLMMARGYEAVQKLDKPFKI